MDLTLLGEVIRTFLGMVWQVLPYVAGIVLVAAMVYVFTWAWKQALSGGWWKL